MSNPTTSVPSDGVGPKHQGSPSPGDTYTVVKRLRILRKDAAPAQSPQASNSSEDDQNVIRLNETAVDGLLTVLQKRLLEQMEEKRLLNQASAPGGGIDPSVSGGRLSARPKKSGAYRRRQRLVKEGPARASAGKALERLESLVDRAERLGVGTAQVRKEVHGAGISTAKGRFVESRQSMARAEKLLNEAASADLPVKIRGLQGRIQFLEAFEPGLASLRRDANSVMDGLKHSRGIEAVVASDSLEADVKVAEQRVVLNLIRSSKSKFLQARNLGLNTDAALALVKGARDRLMKGDIEGAVSCAQRGGNAVDALLARQEELSIVLHDYSRAIALAESLDVDTSMIRQRFVEAKGRRDAKASVQRLVSELRQASHDKVEVSLKLAEKSLADAHEAGADVSMPEETLRRSRDSLSKGHFVNSVIQAGTSMLQSNAAMLECVNDKLRSIEQFSQGVGGEVESMTEVQEAIAHSREKSLEEFRNQARLSEQLVSRAFDSAIAYTKVSQDIVKEAYESAVSLSPSSAPDGQDTPSAPREPAVTIEDRKLRIEDLRQSGRITDSQRERLLAMIELSESKADLV